MCAAPATPLDSGLRRNDETGRSNGCHLFSYEGMKSRSCGLVQRIGAADSATPHPDPCGGQAPALHFLIPPSTIDLQFGTFRRRRAGMEGDWRAHPGSESGTCFHSNRSCRLPPAHQGMKSRSCGLVQRICTADSATPHPDPCGGQAPALHFLIPPSTIGLQFGTPRYENCVVVGGDVWVPCVPPLWIPAPYRGTGHASDRRNDETGRSNGCHLFSYE